MNKSVSQKKKVIIIPSQVMAYEITNYVCLNVKLCDQCVKKKKNISLKCCVLFKTTVGIYCKTKNNVMS